MPKSKAARLKEIVSVMYRYDVFNNLMKQTNPDQIRKAFETLGPTFVKVGQMLSVRTDIFSLDFTRELRKLQDEVKRDSYLDVEKEIKEEFGHSPQKLYLHFDKEPFASASIGQAHRAVLLDGTPVVVKVQHPHIAEEIHLDLDLFQKALPLAKYRPESNVVDLKSVLKDLRRSLDNEMDFTKEASYAELFYKLNNGWKEIRVPKIYHNLSSKKVLTMSLMKGDSLKYLLGQENSEIAYHQKTNQALKADISQLLIGHFMKQVFEDGFFHADPHPGNILLEYIDEAENEADPSTQNYYWEGEFGHIPYELSLDKKERLHHFRLNFIDFGMMGYINRDMQAKMTNMIVAVYSRETQRIANAVLAICEKEGPFSEEQFTDELDEYLMKYINMPVKEIDLQQVFTQVLTICKNNHLQIDRSIMMLIKALGTLEGVIEDLTPELSLMEAVAPFAQKYFLRQFQLKDELQESAIDLWDSLKSAPKIPARTYDLIDNFARGKGKVTLQVKNQSILMSKVEAMVNRIVIGLILSALVIGSSLLVRNSESGHSFVNIIGILGYVAATISILYLAFDSFLQRRKTKKEQEKK